jgi:hypothetical protein
LNITPFFDNRQNCIRFIGVGRDVPCTKKRNRITKDSQLQVNKITSLLTSHIVSHNIRSHTSNLEMVLDIIDSASDDQEKLSYLDI